MLARICLCDLSCFSTFSLYNVPPFLFRVNACAPYLYLLTTKLCAYCFTNTSNAGQYVPNEIYGNMWNTFKDRWLWYEWTRDGERKWFGTNKIYYTSIVLIRTEVIGSWLHKRHNRIVRALVFVWYIQTTHGQNASGPLVGRVCIVYECVDIHSNRSNGIRFDAERVTRNKLSDSVFQNAYHSHILHSYSNNICPNEPMPIDAHFA